MLAFQKTYRIIAILAAFCVAILSLSAGALAYPPGFVSITDVIPDAELDIKYYSEDNFVGSRIDSYRAPVAIMTVEAASALKRAARSLESQGYGLKIFDAYRPQSAVAHFVKWGRDLKDVKTKGAHYPDVAKSDLFKKGYIASKSGHSRGSTLDLTITDLSSGEDVDMGSPFDFFGNVSHPGSSLVTREQASNRKILSDAMTRAGFKPISTEWWHFSLLNEPYPDKYFDFPVDHPATVGEHTAAYLDTIAGGTDKVITAVPSGKTGARVRAYLRTGDSWSMRFETAGFFGRNGNLGSEIFLNCSKGYLTEDCVSVPEGAMIFFLVFIDEGTKIAIGES